MHGDAGLLQGDGKAQDKRTRRVALKPRDVMRDEKNAHAGRVASGGTGRWRAAAEFAPAGVGIKLAPHFAQFSALLGD